MHLTYKSKLNIFKISWCLLMFGTICDVTFAEKIPLPFYPLPLQSASFVLLLYLITFFLISSVQEVKKVLQDRNTLKVLIILGALLIIAFISSAFSVHRRIAVDTTFFRYTLYYFCFIITLVYSKTFKETPDFLLKSFIYFNFFIIISCLFDFYIPRFNRILIDRFGHMEARHSQFRIGNIAYIRPSGFVTDSDLTAFTISISFLLMLIHLEKFKFKYFKYIFIILAGYIFGMLASRSALIIVLFIALIIFIFKYIDRKKIINFTAIFFVVQLLTPQTQARIGQLFNKSYIEQEMTGGRPLIWKAAFIAFKTSPVIGIGSSVFFFDSRDYIMSVLKNDSKEIRDPNRAEEYWELDRTSPHSIILAMLTEYGIIGLAIFLTLLLASYHFLIKKKAIMGILFISGLLFVSTLSNYAPYYRYYLLLCILLYILGEKNMQLPCNRQEKIQFSDIKKILIFKLCCFGDVLQITPVISALKKNYPDTEITIIASSWIKKLAPYLNHINDVIIFDAPFEKNIFRKTFNTIGIIFRLRKRKFDLAFLGHRKSIFGLILKLAGIKYRLGFEETKFLNYTTPFDHNIHTVLRHLKILEAAGIHLDDSKLDLKQLTPVQEIKQSLKTKLDSSFPGYAITNKFIIGIFPFGGSNPGTSMDIKRWNYKNYIQLTKQLSMNHPECMIVLFEGVQNQEKLSEYDLPANIIKLTIDIDLISICNLFISGDTGPLYIAEGLRVSSLSIFGPSDPRLVAPRSIYEGITHENIWKKPECSPCYTTITAFQTNNQKYWKDKTFICWKGTHECMKELTVDEVFKIAEKIITKLLRS